MSEGFVDLHVHSSKSDGTWSPEEMVRAAASHGLRAVALTDHDTIDGIDEAETAGKDLGTEIIAGVELSTELDQAEVHILGYLFDRGDPDLIDLFKRMHEQRNHRAMETVERLRNLGYEITPNEVESEAGAGTIGRPHLARVLIKHGYVRSVQEAFDTLIGRGKPAYVPRPKLDPFDAIVKIRSAGGIPVIAHPGLAPGPLPFGELVSAGLMGIEVYYTEHDVSDVTRFLTLAQHYGLVVTGGSDSHGPDGKARHQIGEPRVEYEVVRKLKALAAK